MATHRYARVIATFAFVTTAAPIEAQAPRGDRRPPTPDDYGRFERLGTASFSPDGRWLAVPITRVDESFELRVHRTEGDSVVVIRNGSQPTYSADGRWLAYYVGFSPQELDSLRAAGLPLRLRGGLMDLERGDTTSTPEVFGFRFSDDGHWIAMMHYAPGGNGGADVRVRSLTGAGDITLGNVADYHWQPGGSLLAYTVHTATDAGNGVRLYDPTEGTLRALDTDGGHLSQLAWHDAGRDLAVLRAAADSAGDTLQTAIVWRDVPRTARRLQLGPTTPGFPDSARLAPRRSVLWSDDSRLLYLGVQPVAPARDTTPRDVESPSVEVWHTDDIQTVPAQKAFGGMIGPESGLVAWHVDAGRVVPLAATPDEAVTVAPGDRYAIALDERPYAREGRFGPTYADVYRVDIETGARDLLRARVEFGFDTSPDGRYYLFYDGGHFYTIELRSGRLVNVTASLATSFANTRRDMPSLQPPPYGTGGWIEGERAVLLYDAYDVWAVRPDGTGGARLTRGAADSIVHRYQSLDWSEDFIPVDAPIHFIATDRRAMRQGFVRSRCCGGREPTRPVWRDARVTRLIRAERADVYAFVVERFDDPPDYFVAGPALEHPRQLTVTNPTHGDFAWGHAEVVEYENTWGEPLRGALFYPATFVPGQQYPMVVHVYERLAQTLHGYVVPRDDEAFNTTVLTGRGYFVFQPDIAYRERAPGRSAVAAIGPALDAVLATGHVDSARMALVGHSWGGYETVYTITQTDRFAAAVAGAPLVDLFSMYLSMFWSTGDPNALIFETNQARMAVPFWEDIEAYRDNSPVFHIERLNTPLLVAFGTEDSAVDFNQGVELYNAARRAGKPLVMLVYEGEDHTFTQPGNRRDYQERVLAWLDHYLRGASAPTWITDGVPYDVPRDDR